jgi:hypothetical protein
MQQRATTSDNKQVTMSNNEQQRVTMNNNEQQGIQQQMTTNEKE